MVGKEPFAAATREAAYALAKQHKPDRDPLVFFLPKERNVQFPTILRLESDEGSKTFTGVIGVFTDLETCDTPGLGRDVLDNFRLIFDRGR